VGPPRTDASRRRIHGAQPAPSGQRRRGGPHDGAARG